MYFILKSQNGVCLVLLKYFNWNAINVYFTLAACLFIAGLSAQPIVNSVRFQSNKETVVLSQYNNDVLSDEKGKKYAFNKKIIIKSLLSEQEIIELHSQITQVQVIAKMQGGAVYWVTPEKEHFFDVFSVLKAHQDVAAVEPDIAPVRKLPRANHEVQPNKVQRKEVHVQASSVTSLKPPFCHSPIKKVRAAIIDDGFDFSHSEFNDLTVLLEYDADEHVLDASAKKGIDYHGTLVAGVIAAKRDNVGGEGFAPTSEIIAIRQVSTWTSSLIVAFHVAKLMKADVINCSWVLPFLSNITSEVIEDLASAPNDPIIVVSAGNNGKKACEMNQLSKLDKLVVVGSLNKAGELTEFSNHGECVDYYAPSSIQSTSLGGYADFGGTSSSAAIVSGIIAQLKACGVAQPLNQLHLVEHIKSARSVVIAK
ncbi:S8/S53 family peptidase [Pseudoalteromonas sp. MMG012]|uniref:S8 family peptidase n=1 Tax=Pseudoalteromonas sp. MMG012 TaxID=2822686 RepID=UPI001B3A28B2|nr:S8/S53 family peptidase [Pseudoalteromonas sp. MMG012]MBQ4851587.1 S8/S53 family peptidase [Pseudoalteromonas sp. MMG012]